MRLLAFIIVNFCLKTLVTSENNSSGNKIRDQKNDGSARELMFFKVEKKYFKCDEGCNINPQINGSPVCGDNGIIYQNECIAVCQGVTIKALSECSNDIFLKNRAYETKGKVTKTQLDRFKNEHFFFIARRKFINSDYLINSFDDTIERGNSARKALFDSNDKNKNFALRVTAEGDEYYAKIENDGVSADKTSSNFPLYDRKHVRKLRRRKMAIIEHDTRTKVCLHESCYPYSTIGEFDSIVDGVGKVKGGCSGTVISPTSVITVAHCHYFNGTWSDFKQFAPGRYLSDKGIVNPYGVWQFQSRTVFYSWSKDQSIQHDIAIIKMAPQNGVNIGDKVGWMSISPTTNNSPALQMATITGYPDDKDHGEMWTSGPCLGGFEDGNHPLVTSHDCDTFGTSSGSALLDLNGLTVYGVHVERHSSEKYDYSDETEGKINERSLKNTGVIIHKSNIASIKKFADLI